MKIIAVSNQKGGVGKTTTATNLAYGLQLRGKKVLLVDADPQGNSTDTWRAIGDDDDYPTLSDVLFENKPVEECIQHTEAGDILAADGELANIDKYLPGFKRFYRLKECLEPLKAKYDHIIIDTNPHVLLLLQNALIAADGVILPLEAGYYEISGMVKFSETIADVQSMPNPNLKLMGILVVRHEGGTNIHQELVDGLPTVAEQMGTIAFETKIRKTVNVKNAQASRLTIHEYNPNCTAAVDYMAFVDELEKRGMV